MLFSQKTLKFFSLTAVIAILISAYFLFIVSWFFQEPLPSFGIIDNQKMLILVTMLYVILTYKVFRSNYEIFQNQRMPYFKVYTHLFDGYKLKNISEFPAINILITLELLYPIPRTTISSIKEWIIRTIKTTIFLKLWSLKPNYFAAWMVDRLESGEEIKVTIEEELTKFLSLELKEENGKKNFISKDEIDFIILIKCEYSSIDGLLLENPHYNIFKWKANPSGMKFISKTGEPIKIK